MKKFLELKIIELESFSVSIYHVILIAGLTLVTLLFLFILKKLLFRSQKIDEGRRYALFQIVRYLAFVFLTAIILETIGIDVTLLIAGSAALLVGLGFGLQNLFNDFVSGIILLVDGSVKVNDVIEINGLVARVKEIGLRTSKVLTRDDKFIIVPNSNLTSEQLINWSHSSGISRFEILVGVAYGSNVELALTIIRNAAVKNSMVIKDPAPVTRLINFGDSSLDLQLLFWTNELFYVETLKSQIRIEIYNQFNQQGVEIPFPQRTVHIKN